MKTENPFKEQNPDWYGEDDEAFYAFFIKKREILYSPKNIILEKPIKFTAVGTWAVKAAIIMFKDLIDGTTDNT